MKTSVNNRIRPSANDRALMALSCIVACGAIAVTLFPLYFVFIASFSSPNDVMLGRVVLWPVNVNLKAYQMIFKNSNIWLGYRNTILYTSLGTLISVSATMTGAFVFSRKDLIGSRTCMYLVFITMYFSGGLIPNYFNIRNLGLLNTMWALVLPSAISGYNMIVCRTFIQSSIPDALEEAAVIDGCTPFRFYLKIVLPLSMPIIAVQSLYSVVGNWNAYYSALIYLQDRSKYPLQLILREILIQNTIKSETMGQSVEDMEAMLEYMNIAESMKYGLVVISSLPMLVFYPFVQKFFIKGIMIGSIKG